LSVSNVTQQCNLTLAPDFDFRSLTKPGMNPGDERNSRLLHIR